MFLVDNRYHDFYRGGSAVGLSVCPASGRLGVRIPGATSRKSGSDNSIAKCSAKGVGVMGPL